MSDVSRNQVIALCPDWVYIVTAVHLAIGRYTDVFMAEQYLVSRESFPAYKNRKENKS